MNKKIGLSMLLTIVLFLCASGSSFAYVDAFYYDEPSSWSSDAIETLAGYNVLEQFAFSDYQSEITRLDFVYLAVRLYEELKGTQARLKPDDYFSDTTDIYALKAAYIGITSGISEGKFGPDVKLSREQLATMMVKTLEIAGVPLSKSKQKFADEASVSAYAKDAISKAFNHKILLGANNKITPKQNATVEQALLIFKNALDQYDGFDNKALSNEQLGELSSSVVKLYVDYKDGSSATASAFCIDGNEFITNYHVLKDAVKVVAEFDNGEKETLDVIIFGYDKRNDIVDFYMIGDHDVKPLKIGSSHNLKRGQAVTVISSPYGLLNTMSMGIISAVRDGSIQVTASISPGSSGGVLINAYGEAIGIISAAIVDGENLGFAIPINEIKTLQFTVLDLEEFVAETSAKPDTPKLAVKVNSDESLTINWDLVDAEYYELYESIDGSKFYALYNDDGYNEWYNDDLEGLTYIDPIVGSNLQFMLVAVKEDMSSTPAFSDIVKINGKTVQGIADELYANFKYITVNGTQIQLSGNFVYTQTLEDKKVYDIDLCFQVNNSTFMPQLQNNEAGTIKDLQQLARVLAATYGHEVQLRISYSDLLDAIDSRFLESNFDDSGYEYLDAIKKWILYYPVVEVHSYDEEYKIVSKE
ncbi:S1C family serine protease [Fusibacter bizertensis]